MKAGFVGRSGSGKEIRKLCGRSNNGSDVSSRVRKEQGDQVQGDFAMGTKEKDIGHGGERQPVSIRGILAENKKYRRKLGKSFTLLNVLSMKFNDIKTCEMSTDDRWVFLSNDVFVALE